MDAFPRSMRDPAEIERRRAMLSLPHIAPLANYAVVLRRKLGCEVPDFDPLDGGVEAQILFLFEKPGPMTAVDGRGRRVGSGFISRDNDDETAEATSHFMREAGIPRRSTVLWNAVPGWNGTVRVTAEELRVGASCLTELAALLKKITGCRTGGEEGATYASAPWHNVTHDHILASSVAARASTMAGEVDCDSR